MLRRRRSLDADTTSDAPPTPPSWFDETYGWTNQAELLAALDAGDPDPLHQQLLTIVDVASLELRIETLAPLVPLGPALDHWVERHGSTSVIPHCVRGRATIEEAWRIRGTASSDQVPKEAWTGFFEHLRLADTQLRAGGRAFPTSPLPWTWLLRSGRGLEIPPGEQAARFERGCRNGGPLTIADREYLQSICEKWGGSHEEMFAFARTASQEAPDGSSRHLLPVLARFEYARTLPQDDDAPWLDPEAQAEVTAAAARFVDHPGLDTTWSGLVLLNAMALEAWRFELPDVGRRCHERIAGRYTTIPWTNQGDPAAMVRLTRAHAGLPLI